MAGIGAIRRTLVLWLLLLAPAMAVAGPYLGEWGWCWHAARDCPRGAYSPLHYWVSELYRVRAVVHPANLDQFPAGPCVAVPPTFESIKYRCPAIPATLPSPYADPAGYYGGDRVTR